jgi:hypothetical protein
MAAASQPMPVPDGDPVAHWSMALKWLRFGLGQPTPKSLLKNPATSAKVGQLLI